MKSSPAELAHAKRYREKYPDRVKARSRRYYEQHRERILARVRAYYLAHKAQIARVAKARYEKTKPQRLAYLKAYAAAHPEKCREWRNTWRRKNPERAKAIQQACNRRRYTDPVRRQRKLEYGARYREAHRAELREKQRQSVTRKIYAREYERKHAPHIREKARVRYAEARERLTDRYIAELLGASPRQLSAEMLEVKRLCVKIKRLIGSGPHALKYAS